MHILSKYKYIYIYKWHACPGSYTKYLEQMILGKTLNMVIRFLLNSLSREVSIFLDLGSRPGSGPGSGCESGPVTVQTHLDLELDLGLHLGLELGLDLDLNLGQWLSRPVWCKFQRGKNDIPVMKFRGLILEEICSWIWTWIRPTKH